ncbi:MAG TPA: VCBS repeat-containing protein [Phnomibacter sp.]|nr:VCBS repeat-containing protein [Phnomibacter sp.]
MTPRATITCFWTTRIILVTLTIVGLSACRQADSRLRSLSPADTGIGFTNTLHEAPQFNILYYLYYYNGGGVATGDVNNDGLPDIYFTANHPSGNKLYINKGNLQFEDVTEKAGVAGNADWSTGVTMADVNGDGLLDIYVCAVSGQFGLQGHNELFLNKGDGTFAPMANAYGIDFSGFGTQAAFFDMDHDGDLDLYLLNHSKRPHANVVDTSNRHKYDPVAGDRLYRQDMVDGKIRFTDISKDAGIYQSNLGYGLGIAIADLNNDGWDDIYIGNDFHENDHYYINNGNGTFTEAGAEHFRHYSRFSMGNDAADFDNDGHVDIITVDMLPPDEKTLKTYGSDENPNIYKVKLTLNGYQDQVSRNCLQRNNGNGVSFSETALLSGVHATDWSWAPLFADLDNDGLKDLFVSSGIVKRPVDMDYIQFVSAMQAQRGLNTTDKYDEETIERMPDGSSHPFIFRGSGGLRFEDVSKDWGTADLSGYFNGAAYADLDKDGDLDIVINCINAPAVVLENRSSPANWLRVELRGDGGNTYGIGAKAYLFAGGTIQFQHLMPTRGFQSSCEPILHFGLGSQPKVDSLLIVWPDQRYEIFKGVSSNALLTVKHSDAHGQFVPEKWIPVEKPLFDDLSTSLLPAWKHQENDFLDLNRQYLLPHMQSTRGPKVAVADVNGDGLDDLYVCGAHGQSGQLMLQRPDGTFRQGNGVPFAANAACEEIDAVFFDANGDGYPDLYVASGGYQYDDGDPVLSDHLYFNDGKGTFAERAGALPPLMTQKSCVAVADIDDDGDVDIFVGALAHAGKFGTWQPSQLLLNDGKGNMTRSDLLPQDASTGGMVTSAVFADMDGDRRPDLVVAGEWMPITIYMNRPRNWERKVIEGSSGLWQAITAADINADGKPDIIAGNWGLNSKLAAGKNGPLKMYVHDFDKNGREEQIMAYTIDGKEYTFLAKDELERALPVLKKAYLTYGEVAGQTVQYMFYDLFKDYREWKAETLASMAFVNKGNEVWTGQVLPDAWQLAPVMTLLASSTGDKVIAGGNFFGVVPYEGRYDALTLSAFQFGSNSTDPKWVGSMPSVNGEVRDAKWINVQGEKAMVLARNNLPLMMLKPKDMNMFP